MANEQSAVTRVADREELPLLLDWAREFAGQYIESLEERPVFPSEKSLRAIHVLLEPLPVKLVPVDDQGRVRDYQMRSWTIASSARING